VAVVGGGSTYTPELVDGLCDLEDRMVVDDLVLLDPSDVRRDVVGLQRGAEEIIANRAAALRAVGHGRVECDRAGSLNVGEAEGRVG